MYEFSVSTNFERMIIRENSEELAIESFKEMRKYDSLEGLTAVKVGCMPCQHNNEVLEGYIGGTHEDCGLYPTEEEAQYGMACGEDQAFFDIFKKYDCKKVRITIEVLE